MGSVWDRAVGAAFKAIRRMNVARGADQLIRLAESAAADDADGDANDAWERVRAIDFVADSQRFAKRLPKVLKKITPEATRLLFALDDSNMPAGKGIVCAAALSHEDEEFDAFYEEIPSKALSRLFNLVGGDEAIFGLGYGYLGMAVRDAFAKLPADVLKRRKGVDVEIGHAEGDSILLGVVGPRGVTLKLKKPTRAKRKVTQPGPRTTGKKAPPPSVAPRKDSWKTDWPATREIEPWLIAMAEKAQAIEDTEEYISQMSFAIERLSERGLKASAKRFGDALIAEIGELDDQTRVDNLGDIVEAFIALGDRDRARALLVSVREHLVRNEKKLKPAKLKEELDSVRSDALANGFGELYDDLNDQERAAQDWAALRERARQAIKQTDRKAMAAIVKEAEGVVPRLPAWHRRMLVDQFVEWYAEAGDKPRALAALKTVDPEDLSVVSIGDVLVKIGQKQRAIDMARDEIDAALKEARAMDLPNYHHPASTIRHALEFLVKAGEQKAARQQLGRVLEAVKTWPVKQSAWVAAAVYTQLAGVVAQLDGRTAAEALLAQAAGAARGEKAANIRGGAWSSLIDLYRQLGAYDDALALVKHISEADQRRLTSVRILAQAGRWDEMREVLRGVKSPNEACDVAWFTAYALENENATPT